MHPRGRCAKDNGVADVYVRDTRTNVTRRISRSVSGGEPNGASYDPPSAATADSGLRLEASNLTRDRGRRGAQIYVHDLISGTTELISRTRAGRRETATACGPRSPTMASGSATSPWLRIWCDEKCRAGQADINLHWDVYPSPSPDRRRRSARAATAPATGSITAGPVPRRQRPDRRIRHASPDRRRDDGYDEDLVVQTHAPRNRRGAASGGSVRNPDSRLIRCRLARRIGHRISRMVRSRLTGT